MLKGFKVKCAGEAEPVRDRGGNDEDPYHQQGLRKAAFVHPRRRPSTELAVLRRNQSVWPRKVAFPWEHSREACRWFDVSHLFLPR